MTASAECWKRLSDGIIRRHHKKDAEQFDDMTMMCLSCHGPEKTEKKGKKQGRKKPARESHADAPVPGEGIPSGEKE
jgi:cytochrome c553